ncbi:MAG: hypothetical protein JSS27_16430 [Planctomycetes bacterium]|nr:hypothetical protein [Planctomycetota bacterium]
MRRRAVIWRFCSASLLVLAFGVEARAGWPFHRSVVRATPDTAGYAPTTSRYTVIVPRVLPVDSSSGIQTPDVVWEQQRPAAPMYPWGWFGTREAPQSWAHTSYYGNSYSVKALRQN